MASPGPGLILGGSTWPLQWVRFLKDFAFDLGCVAVLMLLVQWFVPALSRRQRLILALPLVVLLLAGARGMPEFWAYPLMRTSRDLPQDACLQAPQALVVLGGGLAGADDLALSTMSRVRHAAQWVAVLNAEQRKMLRIYLSGGPSLPDVQQAESHLMREAFQVWRSDLPETNIIPESESLNTRDNATRVAALLKRDFSYVPLSKLRVALVTSWLHMPRAIGTFRAVGVNACPVPSPAIDHSSEGFLNFRNGERTVRVLNEYAGFLGYRVMGWVKR